MAAATAFTFSWQLQGKTCYAQFKGLRSDGKALGTTYSLKDSVRIYFEDVNACRCQLREAQATVVRQRRPVASIVLTQGISLFAKSPLLSAAQPGDVLAITLQKAEDAQGNACMIASKTKNFMLTITP
jgi:hypothetical protein